MIGRLNHVAITVPDLESAAAQIASHMGDIVRLKNEGYNLLSPDPEEVKRALLHIQSNERYMLTVPGTPIAKKQQKWV